MRTFLVTSELTTFLLIFSFTQPRDILCGAADEVLVALKDDKLKVLCACSEISKMYHTVYIVCAVVQISPWFNFFQTSLIFISICFRL